LGLKKSIDSLSEINIPMKKMKNHC